MLLRELPKHLARIVSTNFLTRVHMGTHKIIEYLVHATIHLAIDFVASGSLVHQTIELPVCAQRTLVFGSASSPPSLACPLT